MKFLSPSVKRRFHKRLLFILVAMCLGLGILEIGIRSAEKFHWLPPKEETAILEFQRPQKDLIRHISMAGENCLMINNQVVPAEKPENESRIILLGGSAAMGWGVAPTMRFSNLIENLLNEYGGERRFRILNLAGIGLASPQLADILGRIESEVRPDLILTVMGNNEYLDLASRSLAGLPPVGALDFSQRLQDHLALARFLRPRLQRAEENKPMPIISDLKKNDQTVRYAVRRLEESLTAMELIASKNHAPMIVCTVPSNRKYSSIREWFFAGWPEQPEEFIEARWALRYGLPQKALAAMDRRLREKPNEPAALLIRGIVLQSLNRTDEARREFEEVLKLLPEEDVRSGSINLLMMKAIAVRALMGGQACLDQTAEGRNVLEEVVNRDRNENTIGLLFLECGDVENGRRWLERGMIYRYNVAGSDINTALLGFGRGKPTVRTFDLESAVVALSDQGIPAWEWFLDYCHYSVRGHVLVAHLLAPVIADALGLRADFPKPIDAVAQDDERRRGRTSDVPELDKWAGVNYRITLLTNELIDEWGHMLPPLRDHITKYGVTDESANFMGNWKWISVPDKTVIGQAAIRDYSEILKSHPAYTPAQFNIDWIEQQRLRLYPAAVGYR